MKNTFSSILLTSTIALTFCNCDYNEDLLGNWKNICDADAKGHSGAVCFVIDGKAYMVGGMGFRTQEEYYLDTWQFNPDGPAWEKCDDVPAEKGRAYGLGFSIGKKGYFGTGIGKEGIFYKDFYEFDPYQEAGSQWVATDSFPGDAIGGGLGFTINGIGYGGCGVTKYSGTSNTLYEYHQENADGEKWSKVKNIALTKRAYGSVFIIDDRAYIIGGTSNNSYIRTFERFDPSVETGELRLYKISSDFRYDYRKDQLDRLYRERAVAFAINGRGYLIGGSGASGVGAKSDVWEYIPYGGRDNLGHWAEVTSFEGPIRYGACGFAQNGAGYVFCGQNGSSLSSYYSDVWQYCPQEDYEERQDR